MLDYFCIYRSKTLYGGWFCTVPTSNRWQVTCFSVAQGQMIGIVNNPRQLPIIWMQNMSSWEEQLCHCCSTGLNPLWWVTTGICQISSNCWHQWLFVPSLPTPYKSVHNSTSLLCTIPSWILFFLIWDCAVFTYHLIEMSCGLLAWVLFHWILHVWGHVPLWVPLPSNSRKAIIALPFRKDLGLQDMDTQLLFQATLEAWLCFKSVPFVIGKHGPGDLLTQFYTER